MDFDSLRPPGTVEVQCSYPGCGMAWWMRASEVKGVKHFDCGSDHKVDIEAHRCFSLLRLQYGITCGITRPMGPLPKPQIVRAEKQILLTEAMPSMAAGVCRIETRDNAQRGVFEWTSVAELKSPEEIRKHIRWGAKDCEAYFPDEEKEAVPEGYVPWVGYQTDKLETRRYTFVPCVRRGCTHKVMVDVENPSFRPTGHSVGSWGGGSMPAPPWWGTGNYVCEEGVSTSNRVPCHLALNEALREYEEVESVRWTMWHETLCRPHSAGTLLFYNPDQRLFGLFLYENEDAFTSTVEIRKRMIWGRMGELELILRRVRGETYDEVLSELQIHTSMAS